MNLDTFSHENETDDRLVSTTKIFTTLIAQTQTKPRETIVFGLTQPYQPFSVQPPISIARA